MTFQPEWTFGRPELPTRLNQGETLMGWSLTANAVDLFS
eukprot:COSAG02_NODE_5614_length_4181_cov_11.419157_6_plen_39_part_00